MVTLKDIAKEAGVSITTVSNVVHQRTSRVSPEKVAQIWEIIEKKNYVPSMTARTLANNDSCIIGFISHLTPQNQGGTISDPFLSSFIDSTERLSREEGYFLMIRAVKDAQALASLSRSWQLSGVIISGMFHDDFFDRVQDMSIPFVLLDSYVDIPGVYNIGLEDEQGSYMATKHLLENGHRVIAFASPSIRSGGVIEKRYQGYCRALAEYGIAPDPALVFTQELSVEEGRMLGHRLADYPQITGIVTSADILAAGIMAGLQERGVSIPDEKSIIGFDDNYLCQLTNPPLTTIHQDADRKGELATRMLLSQLRGEPIEEHSVILPVSLVERKSVRNLND